MTTILPPTTDNSPRPPFGTIRERALLHHVLLQLPAKEEELPNAHTY
ncbi:hypothetical protein ACFWXA_08990 [Streptomyces atroolivaceus]